MKRIRVIAPVVETPSAGITQAAEQIWIDQYDLPGLVRYESAFLEDGPAQIMSELDDVLAVPGILRQARRAAAEGCDGVVINCMNDPGLRAVRECLSIPVLGPAETAFHAAAMLGRRVGLLDITAGARAKAGELFTLYGLAGRFASFQSLETAVLDIGQDEGALLHRLLAAALRAVEGDHADVLVLGCTQLSRIKPALVALLASRGFPVPVIDPLPLTLRMAAALVLEGLSHSKRCYPAPI